MCIFWVYIGCCLFIVILILLVIIIVVFFMMCMVLGGLFDGECKFNVVIEVVLNVKFGFDKLFW